MKKNQASRTAEYMAFFRALESARSPSGRLFEDSLAASFLRPKLRLLAVFAEIPFLRKSIEWLIDTKWVAGARPTGVARTKLIDEKLVRALENGARQVVILGSGYDTRAFRIKGIEQAKVFEIDHPNTSKAKQKNLKKQISRLPSRVQFVATDFNEQSLENALSETNFDANLKTFFIWEGVTNYLTAEAVDKTLRAVRRLAKDCSIIFTYVEKTMIDRSENFDGTEELNRVLKDAGERWTFGFNPAELEFYLKERGFQLIEDSGSVEFRSRYLPKTKRNLRGYEFYRVALAKSVSENQPKIRNES